MHKLTRTSLYTLGGWCIPNQCPRLYKLKSNLRANWVHLTRTGHGETRRLRSRFVTRFSFRAALSLSHVFTVNHSQSVRLGGQPLTSLRRLPPDSADAGVFDTVSGYLPHLPPIFDICCANSSIFLCRVARRGPQVQSTPSPCRTQPVFVCPRLSTCLPPG